MRIPAQTGVFSIGLCWIVACGQPDPSSTSTSETTQAIDDGTVVANVEASHVIAINVLCLNLTQHLGSGALITNEWALTAAHVVAPYNCAQPAVTGTLGSQSFSVDHIYRDPRWPLPTSDKEPARPHDMAIVHLSTPLTISGSTSGFARSLTTLRGNQLLGELTTIAGYGRDDTNGLPYGTLRSAVFTVDFLEPTIFGVFRNSSGQLPNHGDSGGPAYEALALPAGFEPILGNEFATVRIDDKSSPAFAALVNRPEDIAEFGWALLRKALSGKLTADFNLDGTDDTIAVIDDNDQLVVQAQISVPGTGAWIEPKVPLFISTPPDGQYVPYVNGDFSGNGHQDFLALVPGNFGQQALYYNGDFTTGLPSATPISFVSEVGFPVTYAVLSPGDFNKDGITDVEATRADGRSSVYLGPFADPTLPSYYYPRGPSFPALGNQQSFAISAVGPSSFADSAANRVHGRANLCSGTGPGLLCFLLTQDVVSGGAPAGSPTSELGDAFGYAMTWGRFEDAGNGLVIAAPGKTIGGKPNAGVVNYMTFVSDGMGGAAGDVLFLYGTGATDERFGESVVAGDFNGDGYDDLVITSRPNATKPRTLNIIPGAAAWTTTPSRTQLQDSTLGVDFVSPEMDLVTGDFNCDGYEDLAIGASSATVASIASAGAVFVVYGSGTGLDPARVQRIDKQSEGFTTAPQESEQFGWRLAAGNFNGDVIRGRPCVDLAISAKEGPGGLLGLTQAGAVYEISGVPGGLDTGSVIRLAEGSAGIADMADPGDTFGGSLAITRANLDAYDDLVVGVYGEGSGVGAMHVLPGSAGGLTGTGEAYWQQGVNGFPDVGEHEALVSGDFFGYRVGGTANGLIVASALFEDVAPLNGGAELFHTGWAAVVRTDDTKGSAVDKQAVGVLTEETLGGALQARAGFGFEITRARPGFVPNKGQQQRWQGQVTSIVSRPLGSLPCQRDDEPPVIRSVTVDAACIWPPNKKWAEFGLGEQLRVVATDNCTASPSVQVVGVHSNEAPGRNGPDYLSNSEGACVRAERKHHRIYAITVEARDAAGNTSRKSVLVTVPHKKSACCDRRWRHAKRRYHPSPAACTTKLASSPTCGFEDP